MTMIADPRIGLANSTGAGSLYQAPRIASQVSPMLGGGGGQGWSSYLMAALQNPQIQQLLMAQMEQPQMGQMPLPGLLMPQSPMAPFQLPPVLGLFGGGRPYA